MFFFLFLGVIHLNYFFLINSFKNASKILIDYYIEFIKLSISAHIFPAVELQKCCRAASKIASSNSSQIIIFTFGLTPQGNV